MSMPEWERQARALAADTSKKILAIQAVKLHTGISLADAKSQVEAWERGEATTVRAPHDMAGGEGDSGVTSNFVERFQNHPAINRLLHRELRELPNLLRPGEGVLDLIGGTYANQNGLLVATPSRLLFVGKGLLSLKVEEFPYDRITSTQYETGMLLGSVKIFASGNTATISNTVKSHTQSFADGLRDRLAARESKPAAAPAPTGGGTACEIERLAALHAAGHLTAEEFTAAKRKALGI